MPINVLSRNDYHEALRSFFDYKDSDARPGQAARVNLYGEVDDSPRTASWRARAKQSTREAQDAVKINNEVRDKLVEALKSQFEKTTFDELPKSVRKALVGSGAATAKQDFKFGADGKSTSGKPLTKRRISAVMRAVADELTRAKTQKEEMIGRYVSGNLTAADIKALHGDLTGTPCPVTIKYPEDIKSIQEDFSRKIKGASNDEQTPLEGFRHFFDRGFTFNVGGKILAKSGGKEAAEMEREMRALFKGKPKLVDAFSQVFKASLSILEFGHLQSKKGVRFNPASNSTKNLSQVVEIKKNGTDSFHVKYVKSLNNFSQYTVVGQKGVASIYWRNNPKDNFFEFTCEFDLKMIRGKPVVTATSDPTVKVRIPAGSFTKLP